jgi:hypothetical protein
MSSSTTFTGIGLALQSVTPTNNNTVLRVRFTSDPKRVTALGAYDSLNPSNWGVTGSGFVNVTSVQSVSTDLQSVDLILSSGLPAGTWRVEVVAVKSASGVNLVSPTSMYFQVSDLINVTVLNPGSTNDTCESIIRQHLNPALKGPGWDAVVSGIAAGDCPVFDNAKKAFDQLYVASASGVYLDRITANSGVVRPKNVGISDDVYRRLAVKLNSNKVVQQALLETLAVFYGDDSVRSHATTTAAQPFALEDQDLLTIIIDGKYTLIVNFIASEFDLISVATAAEVAAAITRACLIQNIPAFALAFLDPLDGLTKVRVYTETLGLKGTVQVTLGKAQNALKFDKTLVAEVYG